MTAAQPVVIGMDLGTSSAKAVAFGIDGSPVARGDVKAEVATPAEDRAEQDPERLVEALFAATRELAGRLAGHPVAGVACSGAMHSLMALDEANRPITPSLTWADNRAVDQAQALRARPDAAELMRRTGGVLHPMSPLVKLRWYREEDRTTAERAARWMSAKEYLLLRLVGEPVVDRSMAGASGLYNLATRDWDPHALELAGVERGQLSRLVGTTEVLGELPRDPAERMGLAPGIPVVAGAADGCLASLGTGAMDPGIASLTIGTSGAIRRVVQAPAGDPEGRVFCYPLTDERWVIGGPVNGGGLVLRWAAERLFPELHVEALEPLAAAVKPGAEGLLFVPALVGERAPRWDPTARAALAGLTWRHGREHVLRALFEGVAYQLATVLAVLESEGGRFTAIRASGGFTASPLWLQIVADVLGRELEIPPVEEASCFGAALLGLQALGLADAFDLARAATTDPARVRPRPEASAHYAAVLRSFVDLRERLAGLGSPSDRRDPIPSGEARPSAPPTVRYRAGPRPEETPPG